MSGKFAALKNLSTSGELPEVNRPAATLRNRRSDHVAVVAVATVAALGIVGVFATAPIRAVDHTVTAPVAVAEPEPTAIPTNVAVAWSAPTTRDDEVFTPRPLPIDGVVVLPQTHGVVAVDPISGEQLWSYLREDMPLCSVTTTFGAVQAVFRTSAGCSEVTSLDAQTGQYRATRSALQEDVVAPISSNDQAGVVSHSQVDLWRSDMVRTVVYGTDPAPQEPDMQPHPGCTITAALTRKDNLGVTERCPEDPETSHLRLMKTVPEDSRKPELSIEVDLKGQGHIVAISATHSAVYLDEPAPRMYAFDAEGALVGDQEVKKAPGGQPEAMFERVADLPHHMSWFDGERLYLFDPADLHVTHVFEGVLGTGVAMTDRLLLPVPEGIAVANWSTGEIERTIPVERPDRSAPVALQVSGNTILERRSGEVVALRGV